MRIFAISDLHLSINNPKPMDIFGDVWENYVESITEDWCARVTDDDTVLLPGDFSWAMTLGQAKPDIDFIAALPGKKIILRGNHDYWWSSISAVRGILPNGFYALQNDALRLENYVFFGTRGWVITENGGSDEDKKIYAREIERMKLSSFAASRLKREGDILVCCAHYPPFNVRRENSAVTALIEQSGASAVVYGHLHGKAARTDEIVVKNGIPYYLVSCDSLGNKLLQLPI